MSDVTSQQNLPGNSPVNSSELATLQMCFGFCKPPALTQLAMPPLLEQTHLDKSEQVT